MIWFPGFLLLFLVANVTPTLVNLCPPFEDLQPCYCVSDGRTIRVDCIQVTSVQDVRKALQSLKGMKRVFIDFQQARLDKIPSDLFEGLHVTKLSFTNCELKEFGDAGRSALEGLEGILEEFAVHFSFSEENELKYLNVSQMRAMGDFEIEGNELKVLGNEWFQNGPTSIKNLFILTNFIEELGDSVFAPLTNLRSLWLTGNRFMSFKRSMLPSPAEYLWSLDLTNNEISSLPEDIFSAMPALKEVILAENAIKRIPESTWSSIWSRLRSVYIEDNPLECDSHIEWMLKQSRPYVVKGRCVEPSDRKDVDLKRLIDDSLIEDDY